MTELDTVTVARADERVVCAVLAAQVVALCERVEASTTLDLLWRANDMLGLLAELLRELAPRAAPGVTALNPRHAAALAAEAELRRVLDQSAFTYAQRHDLIRQMADGVVTALERLAADSDGDGGISESDLMALYVSEDQRRVHASVLARSGGRDERTDGAPGTERRPRKGRKP